MRIHNELKEVAGTYPDEVSLLCNISIKFFQAVPEFEFREEERQDNPKMRFYGTLKLNGYLVGKGYGSNKKVVKNVAARLALISLTPTLYEQWKVSRGGSVKADSSGSDSENKQSNGSLTDIIEDVIGDAPITGQVEGKCINIDEEERQAAVAAKNKLEQKAEKENIGPLNQ